MVGGGRACLCSCVPLLAKPLRLFSSLGNAVLTESWVPGTQGHEACGCMGNVCLSASSRQAHCGGSSTQAPCILAPHRVFSQLLDALITSMCWYAGYGCVFASPSAAVHSLTLCVDHARWWLQERMMSYTHAARIHTRCSACSEREGGGGSSCFSQVYVANAGRSLFVIVPMHGECGVVLACCVGLWGCGLKGVGAGGGGRFMVVFVAGLLVKLVYGCIRP